jgi:murein endopeptidase
MRTSPAHAFSCFLLSACAGLSGACTDPGVPELARRETAPSVEKPSGKPRVEHDEVRYTIARGATLRRIANLYKLDYAEIFALNPGLDRDHELGPDTEVVVYRKGDSTSESVGLPHEGSLLGAMPMLEGPGRRLTSERWKMWGTRHTVSSLDRVLRLWASREPDAPEVLVGNLSTRGGGPLDPHKTHQSGRDVDLSYIARWDGHSTVTWQHMSASNLDAALTWKLLRLLEEESDVEVMFMDRAVQRLLLAHAQQSRRMSAAELRRWLEVAPGATRSGALIRHVPGHRDHFHVRFRCPSGERRCRS